MTLALRYAARSHTGLLRSGNEDSVYAGPRVLAVADGMGGHAAGEVASAVAIAALAPLDEDAPGSDLLDTLRARAVAANDHLRDMVTGDAALEGMGTTLTAFLFAGNRLGMLHIGDSRAYLLRDGTLGQITTDHTLVQTLVDEGQISADEASTHPKRNLVTRALDGRREIEPDLSVREARLGDRYLLCSDGLTGPVGRTKTLQEALELPDPQAACDRLVQLALRGGGPDNITVIVADVVAAGARTVPSPVIAGAAADAPQPGPEMEENSSAARARTAEGRGQPSPPRPAAAVVPAARRSRVKPLLVGVLVLVALGGVALAGVSYVGSQYYVGVQDDRVAIFRGVSGSVGGVQFASVARSTDLPVDRLDSLALARVQDGIVATDLPDAERIVGNLTAQSAAICAVITGASPAPSVAATSVATPVATPTPGLLPTALPTPASTPSTPLLTPLPSGPGAASVVPSPPADCTATP